MKVIKTSIGFTEEETESLVSAGKILREALNSLDEDRSTVEMIEDSRNLVLALYKVAGDIINGKVKNNG